MYMYCLLHTNNSLVIQVVLYTSTVSTEMGDRVRVQFEVPDIYFGM